MTVLAHRCRCGHLDVHHERGGRCGHTRAGVCSCIGLDPVTGPLLAPTWSSSLTAGCRRAPLQPPGTRLDFGGSPSNRPTCTCPACQAAYDAEAG